MSSKGPAPIVVDGVWKRYRLGTDSKIVQIAKKYFPKLVDERAIGDFWALKDVSFKVDLGESMGLIGKNGAGKSTTLKVLCGVTQPTRGSFSLQGRVAPLIEVGAGFHQELTGRENIFLNAAIMGMPKAEIEKKFDEIVDFSGLEKFLDTPVKRYSSGMLARLGFTIAAHIEPDVLLVDEVLSVGDLAFVLKSYRKVEEIRKSGIPVLLVSHNLQLIRNFCTKAVWLHDGEVKAEGTPNDVCAAYTRHALDTVEGELSTAGSDSYRVTTDEAITLEGVRFLDGEGNESRTFETGSPMRVELTFTATRPTGPLIFYITVWQAESGNMLTIQNNLDDEAPHPGLRQKGTRRVTMSLGKTPFVAGLHQMSVSISENHVNNVTDWHEKMFSFKVAGGQVGYGAFNAFPEWKFDL
jgi:ABC-type polysaccharide/polyol phosphate transport system ATPase subunit